MFDSVSKLLGR